MVLCNTLERSLRLKQSIFSGTLIPAPRYESQTLKLALHLSGMRDLWMSLIPAEMAIMKDIHGSLIQAILAGIKDMAFLPAKVAGIRDSYYGNFSQHERWVVRETAIVRDSHCENQGFSCFLDPVASIQCIIAVSSQSSH